jgi:hypothetical protein
MKRMGQARWIRSPAVDAVLALCWVPFAVVAHAVRGDNDTLLLVLSAAFLLSFLHQPLTLPLVYGDPDEVARHRRIYLWSPLVFLVVILLGLQVSLAAVAIVAGLWNAEHTLMQRFGITRIYGRKKGQSAGGLERWMLVSWLVLALVWVAADARTEGSIEGLKLGDVNAGGLHLLADLRPVAALLLVPVLLVVVALATTWVRAEAVRWRDGAAQKAIADAGAQARRSPACFCFRSPSSRPLRSSCLRSAAAWWTMPTSSIRRRAQRSTRSSRSSKPRRPTSS